ncbi:MAG: hypothetical protein M1813_002763 [Trichoglossum hirsutum]|nr:MAG: hypothetical protein M1813_002763 [Trichoglossum hirsutum]
MAPSFSARTFEVLQEERNKFWKKCSDLPEDQIQSLWLRALESAMTTDGSTAQPRRWSQHVARSFSHGAQLQSFQTGLAAHAPVPPPLQREYSQQSAPATIAMARSGTQNSSLGRCTSSYGSAHPQESVFAIDCGKDDLANAYAYNSSGPHQQSGPGRSDLQQAPEQILEAPGDYLGRMDPGYSHVPTMSLTSPLPEHFDKKTYDRFAVCSDQAPNLQFYAPHFPSTPTSTELTNDATVASVMSRGPSTIGSSTYNELEMIRISSGDSIVNGEYSQVDLSGSFGKSSGSNSRFSSYDLSFIGAVGDSAHFPSQSFDPTTIAEEMKRGGSNQSTNSTSSNRSAIRRKEVAQASLKPLASKDCDNMAAMPLTSRKSASNNKMHFTVPDGSEMDDNGVAQIEKSNKHYTRPQHPRVHCDKCNDAPEGFRGDHELRRHTDRVHTRLRRAWITVQCTDKNSPTPEVSLTGCKACRQQKKYHADYNAAAHLRRAHFNPRKKRKGKSKVASTGEEREKRAGKGGGDYPGMSVLRGWMREVEEVATDSAHNDSNEAVAETTIANAGSDSPDIDDGGDDLFGVSYHMVPPTGISLNNCSGSADIATTAPFIDQDFTTAYMNYDSGNFSFDPVDLGQLSANEHNPLNAVNTFNEEFTSNCYLDNPNDSYSRGPL